MYRHWHQFATLIENKNMEIINKHHLNKLNNMQIDFHLRNKINKNIASVGRVGVKLQFFFTFFLRRIEYHSSL